MKKIRWKNKLALALSLMLGIGLPLQPAGFFKAVTAYAYTGSATVKAASLNVRSGPGTGYQSLGRLSSGARVTVLSQQTGTDGQTWYNIRYTSSSGAEATGYVAAAYVQTAVTYTTDSDFEAYLNSQGFPESYKDGLRQLHASYPNWVFKAVNTGLDWETVIENESLPPRSLVNTSSISSWKSVEEGAYNWDTSTWTGFDGSSWVAASDGIIRYYMDPRNFLDETYIFQFLSQEYNGNTQTREGLEAMIQGTFLSGSVNSGASGSNSSPSGGASGPSSDDSTTGPGVAIQSASPSKTTDSSGETVSLEGPVASISSRNYNLVGDTIVSLESPGSQGGEGSSSQNGPSQNGSSQNGSSQNGPGASSAGPGAGESPSSGSPSGQSISYVDIIMNAGAQSGVSPYVLAAMILQEQGTQGTSPLISGTYSGYEGYYNYFNVEAYQSGSMSAIQRGLWYASQSGSYGRPWNTVEKSILGGAQNYGENYVKAGQNTFYLKKFNVQGSNLYKHQYMSNIQAAASEGAELSQAYTDQMKQGALEFLIPVYNNMPEQPCTAPTGDGSPNNKLSSLSVDGFVLTPSFSRDTETYDLIVDTSVSSINVLATGADSKAAISGTGTISLSGSNVDVIITVQAENGAVRTYTIHVAKQSGGPTPGSQTGQTGSQSPSSPSSGTESGGPGVSGPGASGSTSATPGGSNVTVVTVTN